MPAFIAAAKVANASRSFRVGSVDNRMQPSAIRTL
jgi:hypothetical protein